MGALEPAISISGGVAITDTLA